MKAAANDLDLVIVRRDGASMRWQTAAVICGGSLSRGRVVAQRIECPLNGTRFRLSDGAVERGPSAHPQPAFEVRERGGGVEVRARES